MGHPRLVLGTELGSSDRATSILNAEPALHSSLPVFLHSLLSPSLLSKTEVKPTTHFSHFLCTGITSMCPHDSLPFYPLYGLGLVLILCLLLCFACWELNLEPQACQASILQLSYDPAFFWPFCLFVCLKGLPSWP